MNSFCSCLLKSTKGRRKYEKKIQKVLQKEGLVFEEPQEPCPLLSLELFELQGLQILKEGSWNMSGGEGRWFYIIVF